MTVRVRIRSKNCLVVCRATNVRVISAHDPATQYLPYDPKRQGVPVTRFTAAPGMLVRRMDGVDDTCSAAVPGEVRPNGS